MRFHFLLTNHYPYGCYRIEDHVKLIAAGLTELGHKVTYGFNDDVVPWPGVNLLVEFFNHSPVVEQVIALKSGRERFAFGLICVEDPHDATTMQDPNFPDRLPSLTRVVECVDFTWTVIPADYSAMRGGERVRFLEYGYAASLVRPPAMVRDIDVLFYGTLGGERRLALFNSMVQRGLSVSATFGILPGFVKYDLLDRARVVADIGRAENLRFLTPARICTALHSGVVVVAEQIDSGPLSSLYRYTCPTSFADAADNCDTIARSGRFAEIGSAALAMFARDTSMAANLRRVMDLPVFAELAAS